MDQLIDDSDRLKPCPFCGAEAEIDVEAQGGHFVRCLSSACAASSALIFPLMDDVKPLLMERWNRRPVTTAPREQATCNKCGYRVCHEDCGAEDYEVRSTVPMEDERIAACIVLLHRMLEAPTSQVSVGWKNAIGPALLALKA